MEKKEYDGIIKDLQKEFGKDVVIPGTDNILGDVEERIPTGLTLLDVATGGGWPVRRFVEIGGKEGTGKSTLAIKALINTQKMGGLAVLIDYEYSLNKLRALELGLDEDKAMFVYPDTVEAGGNFIISLIKKIEEVTLEGPICIVTDTFANALTEVEKEKGVNQVKIAAKATAIRSEIRKITPLLPRNRVCFIAVNQIIENPSPYAGRPETGGGGGLKYGASVRVFCALKEYIEENNCQVGQVTELFVRKNKLFRPLAKIRATLMFSHGFDDVRTTVEYLTENKLILQGGGRYNFDKDRMGFALDKSHRYAEFIEEISKPEVLDKVKDYVIKNYAW